MKKEADVKKKVKEILTRLGAWYYMPVPTGYGSREVVDFMPIVLRGRSIIIETKHTKNAKRKPDNEWTRRGASKWQAMALNNHREAGGLSLLIDETDVDQLEQAIISYMEAQ